MSYDDEFTNEAEKNDEAEARERRDEALQISEGVNALFCTYIDQFIAEMKSKESRYFTEEIENFIATITEDATDALLELENALEV